MIGKDEDLGSDESSDTSSDASLVNSSDGDDDEFLALEEMYGSLGE